MPPVLVCILRMESHNRKSYEFILIFKAILRSKSKQFKFLDLKNLDTTLNITAERNAELWLTLVTQA